MLLFVVPRLRCINSLLKVPRPRLRRIRSLLKVPRLWCIKSLFKVPRLWCVPSLLGTRAFDAFFGGIFPDPGAASRRKARQVNGDPSRLDFWTRPPGPFPSHHSSLKARARSRSQRPGRIRQPKVRTCNEFTRSATCNSLKAESAQHQQSLHQLRLRCHCRNPPDSDHESKRRSFDAQDCTSQLSTKFDTLTSRDL